ncbi:MAG: serine hydroxymethyltransferase [bacterium]|nr:serine hydroxymethyltransferase [bacterium]
MWATLQQRDPEIFTAIQNERGRQENRLELIASENFVSRAVMEAVGSVMTNKYAEGYPGKRYYGGCEFVDRAEEIARERLRQLFNCRWANVQPHSGSQANQAVYNALLQPGDTFMGLSLAQGGHLTHGSPVNQSGRLYKVVSYGVDLETGFIDMDQVAKLAREHKPKMIMTGASAYPRQIDFAKFREIADEVGAWLVADVAHIAGLVVAKLHPDPIPVCHVVTSTTHKTLRGPRGGVIMSDYEGGEILLAGMPKPKTLTEALDAVVFPGIQGGPLMHVIAGKAVAFLEASRPTFQSYMKQVVANAKTLADELMARNWKLVSNGTDNHLILMDLSSRGLTGKKAEAALEHAGITVNKNMVPGDKQSPFVTSGIRVGAPAATTRGMKEKEFKKIAEWIDRVLSNPEDTAIGDKVRSEVNEVCSQFPLYPADM